jgi:CubicO group peptidase (beta-lactamase class C family)
VDPTIEGYCDRSFAAVRDAFTANFASGSELGASLCVGVDGEVVADLWGGWADAARRRSWGPDTVVCAYSCTKGVVAMAAMALVESGMLDLDAPVARVWPEFAANGKDSIPIRWLLTHQGGLPAIGPKMKFGTLSDWHAMTDALAAQEPWWEPGTAHGYHGVTFGHLVGEVIRRVTGGTVDEYVQRTLCAPIGAQFSIGVDEHSGGVDVIDVADVAMLEPPTTTFFDSWEVGGLGSKSYGNPGDCNSIDHVNSVAFRHAEIPAANGHTNARALEALYRSFASGAVCSGALVEEASRAHVEGDDLVMQLRTAFGLGFEITIPEFAFGPGRRTWGHNGSGGSLGMVDPDAGITLGYVMNNLRWTAQRSDERWEPIFDALYGAL